METQVQDWLALGLAMPIAFFVLAAPTLCTVPQVVATLTSAMLSLAFAAASYGLGLITAAIVALQLGAQLKRRM